MFLIKSIKQIFVLLWLTSATAVHSQHASNSMVPLFTANITPGSNPDVSGTISLFQLNCGVMVKGVVYNLTDGYHGFHVHQKGDLGNQCKNAGGHFNPHQVTHASRDSLERHVGDLGNIVSFDGLANIEMLDSHISLDPTSQNYIGYLAFVIHAGKDDLGKGGDEGSLKTGNAGQRSACGIIEYDTSIREEIDNKVLPFNVFIKPGSNPHASGFIALYPLDRGGVYFGFNLNNLTDGIYRLHVHQNEDLRNQCQNAGGYINPDGVTDGYLGNVESVGGSAGGERIISSISLNPGLTNYIGNLAIVVHAAGEGDHPGQRVACGLVEFTRNLVDTFQPLYRAKITPGTNPEASGIIDLWQLQQVHQFSRVFIHGVIFGLTDGLHGFHVHENGDLGNQCKNAGGHFNPHGVTHGARGSLTRHVGDLGNIESLNGQAVFTLTDSRISLDGTSTNYIGNLSFVVHAGEDDLGEGGDEGSLKTGNAGQRSACALIKFGMEFDVPSEDQKPSTYRAEIYPGSNPNVKGTIQMWQLEYGGVGLRGSIYNLTDGLHGFHVHENRDLGNMCKNAGGHFNPHGKTHGGKYSAQRHVGDLGNIKSIGGHAIIEMIDPYISLDPTSADFIGKLAFVVHAGEDDLGKGGNEGSLKTGNAGQRSACGLIEVDPSVFSETTPSVQIEIFPGSNSEINGTIFMWQLEHISQDVYIKGIINGLSDGLHGFHVHERGDLGNQCKNAGGHFNPHGVNHGARSSLYERHVGDLGNIKSFGGHASIELNDHLISLNPNSTNYIGNLALVVHAGEDDLGQGPNEGSLKTGNAGQRSGCGLVLELLAGQVFNRAIVFPDE